MADEAPNSQTLAPNTDQTPASVEAIIDSTAQGGTESSCNNNNVNETCGERGNSLALTDELTERGSKAYNEQDYAEAADCFSRALEIRVAHHGELSPECVTTYYKYGCALLYKAQEEADPLGSAAVPKKDVNSEHGSEKDGHVKGPTSGEASVSSNAKEGSSNLQGASGDGNGGRDQEEDDESDGEDPAADEEESDLDLAWKMLDIARAIAEKQTNDTVEKVDILSALAEVALEREDVETSLSDYLKALSMLERLTEPDSRHIAELNFRICLCLEVGSKGQEAIPYCEKAISVCKSRLQRLKNEIQGLSNSIAHANPESELAGQHSSSTSQTTYSVADKEKEIEILTGLSTELEKKLEDLQQIVSNPSSILTDILGIVAAKAKGGESASSTALNSIHFATGNSSGFESPTVSTAHTSGASGVTHLGVVGRGVKRASTSSPAAESPPAKKLVSDPPAENEDSSNAA